MFASYFSRRKPWAYTDTKSTVKHQMKSPDWSDEFKKKVAPFLRQEITKNVRLVKKRED